jgi:hypothetical protein
MVIVVLILASCWMYAQSSNNASPQGSQAGADNSVQSQSGSATGETGQPNGVTSRDNGSLKSNDKVEIEGCLTASNGAYSLTDQSGHVWQLQGDTSKFSSYAGNQVKVRGKLLSGTAVSSAGTSSNATGGATGTATKEGVPTTGPTRAGNGTAVNGSSTAAAVNNNGGAVEVQKVKKSGGTCSANAGTPSH